MKRAAKTGSERRPQLVLAAFLGVAAFWVGAGVIDSLSIGDNTLLTGLLHPGTASIVLRVAAGIMIIGGSWYTQRLFDDHLVTAAELDHERYKLELVYDNSPDAILIIDSDFTVQYANRMAEELNGLSAATMIGKRCHEAIAGTEVACSACRVDYVLRSRTPAFAVKHEMNASGKEHWVETMWYPVFNEDGTIESVVEIAKDVTDVKNAEYALQQYSERLEESVHERTTELEKTNAELEEEVAERRRAEKALRESEERFRSLVELAPDLILVHIEGIIAFMNPYGARLLGYDNPQDLLGVHVLNLVDAESIEVATERMRTTMHDRRPSEPAEVRFIRKDGARIDLQIAATPLMYHGRPAVQAVAHDVTERKRAEDTIRKMAYYDMLTGLPNRALFDDRLAVVINQAERNDETFAVMFMDMNDFKLVNDRHGHAVGDQLLSEVARRLQTVIRRSDTVARLGGDEFTVLLPKVTSRKAATLVARKMAQAMADPAITDKGPVPIEISIGIAFYPTDGRSFSALMHAADMAMYASKNEGTPFRFVDSGVLLP
ncbi:MAG: diguanylate cyclase [Actinomycetota bacterium]|nr:MAG: diguanylate cyclase/phosphodiesterase with PAS/PAC and GAF [Actinomycetota bacterium]MDO8949239.1 diguanylate cyclase [Actinomycetota bacterium]MDP3631207.1 diguanylate cyclase [Actinomycetota bacterium]